MALVDTNVLVYSFDPGEPVKQRIAVDVLRDGHFDREIVLPHQALVEFVAATTRERPDLGRPPLLERPDALRHAESMMLQYRVLYPDEDVLATALRGAAAYQLSWFDAHLWAYAEVNGIDEILTEDFEHGRHYGSVRTVDPFLAAAGGVAELPAMYGEA